MPKNEIPEHIKETLKILKSRFGRRVEEDCVVAMVATATARGYRAEGFPKHARAVRCWDEWYDDVGYWAYEYEEDHPDWEEDDDEGEDFNVSGEQATQQVADGRAPSVEKHPEGSDAGVLRSTIGPCKESAQGMNAPRDVLPPHVRETFEILRTRFGEVVDARPAIGMIGTAVCLGRERDYFPRHAKTVQSWSAWLEETAEWIAENQWDEDEALWLEEPWPLP